MTDKAAMHAACHHLRFMTEDKKRLESKQHHHHHHHHHMRRCGNTSAAMAQSLASRTRCSRRPSISTLSITSSRPNHSSKRARLYASGQPGQPMALSRGKMLRAEPKVGDKYSAPFHSLRPMCANCAEPKIDARYDRSVVPLQKLRLATHRKGRVSTPSTGKRETACSSYSG